MRSTDTGADEGQEGYLLQQYRPRILTCLGLIGVLSFLYAGDASRAEKTGSKPRALVGLYRSAHAVSHTPPYCDNARLPGLSSSLF